MENKAGVGFSGLLALIFIVLKLTNVINWSWLWVLSPIWLPILIVILFFVFMSWLFLLVLFIQYVSLKLK